jgi:membrane associated rhomboid family serine protease
MRRTPRISDNFTFGGRVPGPIGVLIALTLAASLTAAIGSRHGISLSEWAGLEPARVWRGELWRLVTWVFIEPHPISLLFACLLLYWFGRDLAQAWGAPRFVSVYLGITLIASIVTCLLARLDPDIMSHQYLSNWPLAEAMAVGWGLLYPERRILVYFVFPLSGRMLVYITIGMTVLYAAYVGWEGFVPNLLAESLMVAFVYRKRLRARWLQLQLDFERSRRRARAGGVTHLHPVPPSDESDDPDDRQMN